MAIFKHLKGRQTKMAINGIGGPSEPVNTKQADSVKQTENKDKKPVVTYTANGVTKTINEEEDSLQTFEEDDETTNEEKIINQRMDTCNRQLETLYRQLDSLRANLRSTTQQLAAGGSDIAAVMQSMQSIRSSINSTYDNINKVYITMLSYETDLEASTMEFASNGGISADASKFKFREGASEDGKGVVNTALKYDDKSQSQMKSIMQSKGYRFDDGLWCADFVTFILGETYGKDNIPGDFINTCSNTAGCGSIRSWSQGNGSWTTNPDTLQPGDLVIFDWDGDGGASHVGIFISKNADGTINTVEGNTTGAAGSSCVETKIRAPKTINGYVRLSGLS